MVSSFYCRKSPILNNMSKIINVNIKDIKKIKEILNNVLFFFSKLVINKEKIKSSIIRIIIINVIKRIFIPLVYVLNFNS